MQKNAFFVDNAESHTVRVYYICVRLVGLYGINEIYQSHGSYNGFSVLPCQITCVFRRLPCNVSGERLKSSWLEDHREVVRLLSPCEDQHGNLVPISHMKNVQRRFLNGGFFGHETHEGLF